MERLMLSGLDELNAPPDEGHSVEHAPSLHEAKEALPLGPRAFWRRVAKIRPNNLQQTSSRLIGL
eukprot:9406859-Alexandrium_andersonii.AAC.1